MKKTIRLALLVFSVMTLGLAQLAWAQGTGTGVIAGVEISGSKYAIVYMPAVTGTRPACHNTQYPNGFIFDISTSKGESLLSTIMLTYAASRRITLVGAGSCTSNGTVNVETLSRLF